MRQNPEFIITDVGDDHILVPVGKAAVNFNAIVSLNEMGKTIWELLAEDNSMDGILNSILAEYEVTEETARADIDRFLTKLRENGCIED